MRNFVNENEAEMSFLEDLQRGMRWIASRKRARGS
jgi:hypothetical protein